MISFSAAISACEKGQQWEQALELLETMLLLGVRANIITFNAVLSALEKAGKWHLALDFLEVRELGLQGLRMCETSIFGIGRTEFPET